MNIGIVRCDQVGEKFVAEHGQYPDMFIRLLQKADKELEFVILDGMHGEWPIDADTCDAYLITGSRHSVNDDLPWIALLEHFIRQCHKLEKKVIGVCFGHQLIAKALGGRVIKSPNGWGVGLLKNKITQQKSWMTPGCENFHLLASHQDQVVALPPEAEILAGSDFCPINMIQVGKHFFTIQGHPEFTKAYSRALMDDRASLLGGERYEEGIKSLQGTVDDTLVAQWIVNFLNH